MIQTNGTEIKSYIDIDDRYYTTSKSTRKQIGYVDNFQKKLLKDQKSLDPEHMELLRTQIWNLI